MPFEMRELQGSVFFNDRKSKPSHPDYQGKVLVEGKTYRIAGWVKATQAGSRFLSLKLTLEEPKEAAAARQDDFLKPAGNAAKSAPAKPDFDDPLPDFSKDSDIPF
jgi:uncharacterized protein (DUF736 family)